MVDADGRKLAGLAQARRRTGTLFQCGVLMRWDPATLAPSFEADVAERRALADALAASTTDLAALAPAATAADVVHAVDARLAAAAAAGGGV